MLHNTYFPGMHHQSNNELSNLMKNQLWAWSCTDLGSLIGNTQCGNFGIFMPLRFFKWNQFWSKTAILIIWAALDFKIFWKFWQLQVWNFSKSQNSKPPKLLEWQFLTFWNQPKLISHKIRVAGRLLNFHSSQKSQLGCPGLYCYYYLDFIWASMMTIRQDLGSWYFL